MPPLEELQDKATDDLLQIAFALGRVQKDEASDEYWTVITALHRRPEQAVFDRARQCAQSDIAADRMVAADVLAQLGPADKRRAAIQR